METKFNFKSQICTTREQSERLLALGVKPETADIRGVEGIEHTPTYAWSLHRLIELCRIEGSGATLELVSLDQTYDKYIGQISRMVKEGYFNKDYLCEK